MESRICAVCGKTATVDMFGKGIRCPKTTCLACKERAVRFSEAKTVMMVRRIIKEVEK